MRFFKRGRHLSHSTGEKLEPSVESPRWNREFLSHLHSPWAVLAQWLFNVTVIILLMALFGLQSQFSDYLNARGQYADRRAQEQNAYLCQLISHLHADSNGQLQQLAKDLNCVTGPLPAFTAGPSVPIGPTGPLFTGKPTPTPPASSARGSGRHRATATPSGAPGSPQPTRAPASQTAAPTSEAPPVPSSSGAGGASPTSPDPGRRFCVPLLGCVTI